jgi:dTDP-4-amino-4,6-dideoxygalactose transaminase
MMSPVPFVDLGAQYRAIKDDVDAAILGVLARTAYILGSEVDAFEQAFARFVGTRFCVGVSSGLDALRLAMAALDIGAGDDVIVPSHTFIATALAVTAVGARPVLVDCAERSYRVDAAAIRAKMTAKTRAIIAVHLTGQAVDMDPILALAAERGVQLIEDAAQAHGTEYKSRPCGSLGKIACFSFYPAKNLGAYGDGGAVTTDDPTLAERIRRLRNYGQRVKYEHVEAGLNARLDTVQAAVLGVKLPHLPKWNAARAAHAATYRSALAGVGDLVLPEEVSFSTHIYHQFAVQTQHRDALQQHLTKDGIQTVIHYPIPIHLQGAYSSLGHKRGDFPNAERLSAQTLSLPMFAELTSEQIATVASSVKRFFELRRTL